MSLSMYLSIQHFTQRSLSRCIPSISHILHCRRITPDIHPKGVALTDLELPADISPQRLIICSRRTSRRSARSLRQLITRMEIKVHSGLELTVECFQ